jgi:hypothetical protein
MKNIIIALLLLLLAGCTTETVVLEEVESTPITAMTVAELPVEVEEDIAPYYDFDEGETKIILGHEITLTDISLEPKVLVEVDNIEGRLIETKNEEIINTMKISIERLDKTDINNPKATLKIEELDLQTNQYIIQRNVRVQIEDKDVVLTDSKSSGHISVMVYDRNNMKGEEETLAKGESLEINGLTITNLKNYYKVNQYALITAYESF